MELTDDLRNALVLQNMGLVYHVVRYFSKGKAVWRSPTKESNNRYEHRAKGQEGLAAPSAMDRDLVQAGVIGLMTALRRYEPARLVKPSPNLWFVFARLHVLHEVQKAAAQSNGRSKNLTRAEFTNEDLFQVLSGGRPPVAECASSRCDARHDLRVALSDATEEDLAVLIALADDAGASELAAVLGLPKNASGAIAERVIDTLSRARKGLEK